MISLASLGGLRCAHRHLASSYPADRRVAGAIRIPRTARNGVRVPPRTNASVIAEPACERSGRPDAVVDLAESNHSNAKSGLPGSLAGDVHGEHSDGLVNRVGFCSVVHRSAEKCRDSDRFEPVIWNTAAGYFSAKGRALPRLDKPGGELRRVEVRSDVTGATPGRNAHTQ